MWRDPLLQSRYRRHLADLIELAEKELHRTLWEKAFQPLAVFYHERLRGLQATYERYGGDLVAAFRRCQERGQIEIITSSATHAVLPLLASHPPSVRAQLRVAIDHHRNCFGSAPEGTSATSSI